jgi:hypothetical protein
VGLEPSPLSLVSINEELFEWESSGSGSRKPILMAVGIRCADHATSSIRKSWHKTSPTVGGRSVGIVCLRAKSMQLNKNCNGHSRENPEGLFLDLEFLYSPGIDR